MRLLCEELIGIWWTERSPKLASTLIPLKIHMWRLPPEPIVLVLNSHPVVFRALHLTGTSYLVCGISTVIVALILNGQCVVSFPSLLWFKPATWSQVMVSLQWPWALSALVSTRGSNICSDLKPEAMGQYERLPTVVITLTLTSRIGSVCRLSVMIIVLIYIWSNNLANASLVFSLGQSGIGFWCQQWK